jgi:hypothetical protein
MRQFKCYTDLDGVLVNWVQGVRDLGPGPAAGLGDNAPPEDKQIMYRAIAMAGADFWANLPWLPDGESLWNWISQFNPVILSSPGKFRHAEEGKKMWIKKNIPGTTAFFSEDKWEYAQPNTILIDDKPENVGAWESKRGIGILHTDAASTKEKLLEAIKKISPTRAEKVLLSDVLRGLISKQGRDNMRMSLASFIRNLVTAFQKHHIHDFEDIHEHLEAGPIKESLGKILKLKPDEDEKLYKIYEEIRDEIYKLPNEEKEAMTQLILEPILFTLKRPGAHVDTIKRTKYLNDLLTDK